MRIGLAAASVLLLLPSLSSAGVYTDDLSRCLVDAAKPADRAQLMRWIFSAYAASDAAAGIAVMSKEQHTAANRAGAKLFERLLFTDCRRQAADAVRNEGPLSLQQSFETLGQIAGRGLSADPKVAAQLDEFATMIDPAKVAVLAGKTPPKPTE